MTTIYALSSGGGKSGIAVIRLSGPDACTMAQSITRDKIFSLTPRKAHLRKIYDTDGNLIDQALLLYFPSPNSFTGEDVVEVHVHGSVAVIKALLAAFSEFTGAQIAPPGAFTRRAFENGKMSLLAVEALADLIQAETQSQHKQALCQMEGKMGVLYQDWQHALLTSLAYAEALIDFSEDEHFEHIAELVATIRSSLEATYASLSRHLVGPPVGERIRQGFSVAIVGAPNVGKSSLLNKLVNRPAAIVSPLAGTTRDVLDIPLDIGGWAVTLHDTAGMHQATTNCVEEEGMARALTCARQADVRLFVVSVDCPLLPKAYHPLAREHDIFIMNKLDLSPNLPIKAPYMGCSLQENLGLDTLSKALEESIQTLVDSSSFEFPVVTRARHRQHLDACAQHIQEALAKLGQESKLEFAAQDIRLAIQEISHILGTLDVERVLDEIFAQFCIGK